MNWNNKKFIIGLIIAGAVVGLTSMAKGQSFGATSGVTREWARIPDSKLVRSLTDTQGTLISNNGSTATTSAVTLQVIGTSLFGAASSTNFAILGITGSTQCLQVNTNGTVTGTGSTCGGSAASGSPGAWQNWLSGQATLTPTSTSAGIFVTASSTIQTSFRVDGTLNLPSLTSGSLVIAGVPATATSTLAVNVGGTGVSNIALNSLLLGGGTSPVTTTSTLSVVKGGTGQATLNAGDFIIANGTSAFTSQTTVSASQGGTGATSLTGLVIGNGTSVMTATTTLSVVKGGTGATTFTLGGFLQGGGTSPITASAALTGMVQGQGTSAPTATTTLSVVVGGTGALTFTPFGVLYGGGTSPFGVTAVGNSGQVLTSNGAGNAPTFQAAAAGSSGSPGAWQTWQTGTTNLAALTPTSTSNGIFVTASSTIQTAFRVDGNATTTKTLTVGTNTLVAYTDTGVVGIGTSNPSTSMTLDVAGYARVSSGLGIGNVNTALNTLKIGSSPTMMTLDGSAAAMSIANSNNAINSTLTISTPNTAGSDLIFSPGNSALVYFSQSGKVGIGTASPTSTLNVLGTTILGGNATTTGGMIIGTSIPPQEPIAAGNLYVGGNATSTLNFTVGGLAGSGTRCLQVDNNGLIAVAAAGCAGGSFAPLGFNGSWQNVWAGQNTITPTSTLAGIYVTASSTIDSTLRVTGNFTLPGLSSGVIFGGGATVLTSTSSLSVINGGTGAGALTGLILGNGGDPHTATTTLSVVRGGTGALTFTTGGFLLGGGTSPITASAALTGLIYGNGTSAPTATTTLSVNNGGTGVANLALNSLVLGGGTSPITTTSTLSVVVGGTGALTFTNNAFILGGGTSPLQASALTGLVYGNGASAPTATTTLSVVAGGTGLTTFNSGALIYGGGAGERLGSLTIGSANTVLTSTGSLPQWVSLLTGLTGVSTTNATSTISLVIPNGANPDVDAPGEIAFDTTDGVFVTATSTDTTSQVPFARTLQTLARFTISSSTAITAKPIGIPVDYLGFTVVRVQCYTLTGTSQVITLTHNGASASNNITCTPTTNGDYQTTTANVLYKPSEIMTVVPGTNTGSVEDTEVSIFGTYTIR